MENVDVETWNAYDKLYNLIIENEAKNKSMDVKQIFENGLECFSSYLCHANRDYAYNTTYLPAFKEDFWKFIESFHKKYIIAKKLFNIAEQYYDVTLKIDRYWMLETIKKDTDRENTKSVQSTLNGPDFVCNKETTIECSVLCDMKRYIYQTKEEIMPDSDNFQKLIKEFREFLKKYSSEIQKK